MLVARTMLVCTGIGFGAGWLMPMIRIPFLSCIICYFLGVVTGRWLAKIIDNKMGSVVTKVIVFGILIGLSLSPYNALPFIMVEILKDSVAGQGSSIFDGLIAIVSILFSPVLFIVGVLRPTVWGERW